MTIFIAGATGYTGQALVKLLCEQNFPCVAHIRAESPSFEDKKEKLCNQGATVVTTAWKEDDLRAELQKQKPSHIFSLLGTTKKGNKKERSFGRTASYSSVDRDLTLMLYRAASSLPSPPIFVYLSSFGADKANGAYLTARYEVEQIVLAGVLPYFIVRPGFISGPDRNEFRAGERSATIVSDGILKGLSALGWKSGFHQYGSLTAAELAKGLLHHAQHSTPNQILYTKDLRIP